MMRARIYVLGAAAIALAVGSTKIVIEGRPVAKMAAEQAAEQNQVPVAVNAPATTPTDQHPSPANLPTAGGEGGDEAEGEGDDDRGVFLPGPAPAPTPRISAPSGSGTSAGTGSTATSGSGTGTASGVKSYSMSEVARHSTIDNCWSVVNGNVYDLTNWINRHPGGPNVILGMCGGDGSAAYNGQHGGASRPASFLILFKIGVLK